MGITSITSITSSSSSSVRPQYPHTIVVTICNCQSRACTGPAQTARMIQSQARVYSPPLLPLADPLPRVAPNRIAVKIADEHKPLIRNSDIVRVLPRRRDSRQYRRRIWRQILLMAMCCDCAGDCGAPGCEGGAGGQVRRRGGVLPLPLLMNSILHYNKSVIISIRY